MLPGLWFWHYPQFVHAHLKQIKAKDPLETASPSGGGAQKNALSFKAMRDAMEGIPNAIHGLPDLMQSLVTNVWPSSSEPDKKKDNKSNN